jgi:hypothetical protein
MRLLASLIALIAGCGTRDCKDGTLFLTLSYEGATAGADDLDVTITIGTSSVHPAFQPHGDGDTLQVDFPDGYPAGQTISVDVIAKKSGGALGEGHAVTPLANSCTALALTVNPFAADGGVISDSAMPPPPDLAFDATTQDILPGCPTGKPLFSDTFAGGAINPTWYVLNAGSGSYAIDTMVGHTDSRSLHLRGGPFQVNGGYVEGVGESQSLQNNPQRLFVRAWVFLPANGILANDVRLFDFSARQVMNTPALSLVVTDTYGLTVRNGIPTNPITVSTGAHVVPPLKWFCLEVEGVFAKPNAFNVWIDGQPIGAISGNTPMVPAGGPIDSLELEILQIFAANAQPNPFDVYIDDVVVDTCPIGCN